MNGKRITIFSGHYGSGKTNIALTYALSERKKGKKVAIALLGAPYNAHLIPEGCAVVCCYSLTIEAVSAAIDALKGEIQPQGKLPVKI